MMFAAAIRPVIDRVHVSVRLAARPGLRAVYTELGLDRPGFETDLYYGLLERPVSARALADALVYQGVDGTYELECGLARRDEAGAWHLTERGRAAAEANLRVIGAAAERVWSHTPIATMPGLRDLDRLSELIDRLLEAGAASGGPVFTAMVPVHEPEEASAAQRLAVRLDALRHHRADAHRAAWRAAGLGVEEIAALPEGPERAAIEAETNRLDEPVYAVLGVQERFELLAGLGALADGLTR
jgi:hypothetical protein